MESDSISLVIHLSLLLLSPPLFLGIIAKTKAFFGGRQGPPLFQPYYDLVKLMKKGFVYSRSSSWVLRLAPILILTSILFSGLLLPLGHEAPLHFEGDLILFAYLLGLARFFTILAAMDVGSSFEGMGASREATFGALSELSFFLGLIVLAIMTHSSSLTGLTGLLSEKGPYSPCHPSVLLLFVTFILILLTENSRMPIDDPNTHLELTMIHEVMILDYSGPDLGIILYGASLKLFLMMVLAVSVLFPQTHGIQATGWLFLKLVGLAIGIGVIESINARLRLIKIPQILIANFVIAAFALAVTLLKGGF